MRPHILETQATAHDTYSQRGQVEVASSVGASCVSVTPSFATVFEFGTRVRLRRTELGWSQEQLGREADLHFTYVSSVERGERNISLRNILRLATALGLDAAVLVKGLAS